MRAFISVIALTLFLMLVGCNSQEASRSSGNTSRPNPPGQTPNQVSDPTAQARRITAEDLHKLYQKNEVLIVDTRTEPVFKQSHIPGAILIPAGEFAARADELPRNRMIVTYCT